MPLLALLAACPGRPQTPRVPPAADATIAIDGSIRGVAGDAAGRFVSVEVDKATTTIRAYRNNAVAWNAPLAGSAGPLAVGDKLLACIVSKRPGADTVRGDPAAAVSAIDIATGKPAWQIVFDSTDWAIASSVAAHRDGFIVGGLFGGTLRARNHVVSSAGGSDGFVARVTATGDIAWLVRTGGAGADGVQGVATSGDRIAIAGTFTSSGAELGGATLAPYDERSPFGDAFAAELDGKGKAKWSQTFGGKADDAVAGVAIDARGNVVVAASVREVVHVGSAQLVTSGQSDGILVWYGERGEQGTAVLVGGLEFDGLRAITAVGDKVIAGGFFSGSIKLADRTLTAGGGDDSFIAAFDHNGTIALAWHVGGDGREELASLASIPGGFVAGVAHTAKASIEQAQLAAPKDPMRGGALVVRGMR
ncbi:MAG TPA: hypothetical protein VIV11_32070 [Kofleriaceae bacterium]